MLPTKEFVGLYAGAGIVSSLAEVAFVSATELHYHLFSNIYKLSAIGLAHIPTLGASGALMGVLGFTATTYPNSQWRIFLIPYDISGANLVTGLIFFELSGTVITLLKQFGFIRFGSTLGHRAHLAGLLSGICFAKYVNTQ